MIKINYWLLASLIITTIIALPILTVFFSFFGATSGYYELLSNTFLFSYISQSLSILAGVLILTFIFGVFSAYFVSFYDFPGVNFFKWALENKVIDYIEKHYSEIENDMNLRNAGAKNSIEKTSSLDATKTRKKREELSISATKCIKKESVKIVVKFN